MQSIAYPIGPVDEGCCLWCGEAFPEPTGNSSRKWCSNLCASRAGQFRRSGSAPTGGITIAPSECKGCGAPIAQGPRARNPKQWCSESCRVKNYRKPADKNSSWYLNQLEKNKAKVRERNMQLSQIVCGGCGNLAPRGRAGKPLKYCGKSCAARADRYRYVLEGRTCSVEGCEKPMSGRGLCGAHYYAVWRVENPDKHSARNLRYRAQKRHDGAESFSRMEVMELSNWECHLCGDSIDPECEYPSPLYGTVDHVIPLSKGGTHTLCNVKAAHHICNSTKRDNEDFKLTR